MPNFPTSQLTALTGAAVDTSADILPIVDASATSTKKITVAELANALGPVIEPTAANTSFAQSGTATSENVQSRLRWQTFITSYLSDADRASVRSGTTVNIDTALSLAHTDLPTNGGDIIFPPGKYKLTAKPSLTKRVKLIGAGTSVTAAETGTTVVIKDAAMTTTLVSLAVAGSEIEGIEFEGEAGNTGDGIEIAAGRCALRNVAAYSMGNDGIRIGTDAGVNANLWFMQNIKAKSNGRHGVYISDKASPTLPDCNGGTFIHGDLQSNTSDGLRLGNAIGNTFVGVTVQTNGGDGIHIGADADENVFFGGDWDENNTDKDLEIEAGATRNAIFWPRLTSAKTTDAGTGTVLFTKNATLAQALSWTGLTATASEVNGLDVSGYVRLFDDFVGDSLSVDKWNGQVGSDPQCVAPAIAAGNFRGLARMTSGDDAAATMAVNGVQLDSGLNWRAAQSNLIFEARVSVNAITNVCFFLGFTDQVAALEMPFTYSGTTLTSNASNGVGMLFDTDATTDNWKLVGVASDTDATVQDAGVAPAAGTMETWRIELSSSGVATFYRNGTAIGSTMTGAVTNTAALTPVIACFARGTASRIVDMDYILVQSSR